MTWFGPAIDLLHTRSASLVSRKRRASELPLPARLQLQGELWLFFASASLLLLLARLYKLQLSLHKRLIYLRFLLKLFGIQLKWFVLISFIETCRIVERLEEPAGRYLQHLEARLFPKGV